MAGIAMNKALLSLALLAFLPLVACGPQGDQSSGDEAPLAGAKIGGNFTLVDQDGRKVSYRSEEHTSELQSLMRISYAVCCLKKKRNTRQYISTHNVI